jgi:subtilisin family serine protease
MLLALVPALPAAAQQVDEAVWAALARDGQVRVLVELADREARAASLPARRAAAAELQQRVLRRLPSQRFRVAHRFQAIASLTGTVDAAGLQLLLTSPDVERILLDAGGSGGLSQSVPQIHADVLHDLHSLTGSGVTTAVVDTGIDSHHPDLASSLVAEQCFCSTGGGCCPGGTTVQSGPGAAEDDHGHGTHVSSIITSDGVVASEGVAPDAGIVAVKVLDSTNSFCCASDVIAALDWIANERPDVQLVNMSLGTWATYTGTCSWPSFDAAVDNLTANGVTVFAASMNGSLLEQMAAPACLANTVAVGAVDSADSVAAFSNSSTALDLLAPGVGIGASYLGGGQTATSGTSMATPHAVGAAALLLQADATLAPAEVRTALEAGGVPVTDWRNGRIRPRVDALGALDAIGPIEEEAGPVVAWGDGRFGQAASPSSVNGTTGTASTIAAGGYHSCGIQSETGAVVCWGYNAFGQSTPPASVDGTSGTASAIAAGGLAQLRGPGGERRGGVLG